MPITRLELDSSDSDISLMSNDQLRSLVKKSQSTLATPGFGKRPRSTSNRATRANARPTRKQSPSTASDMEQISLVNAVPLKLEQIVKWSNTALNRTGLAGASWKFPLTYGVRWWTLFALVHSLFMEVSKHTNFSKLQRMCTTKSGTQGLVDTRSAVYDAFIATSYHTMWYYETVHSKTLSDKFVRDCQNVQVPYGIYKQIAIDASVRKTFSVSTFGVMRFDLELVSADSLRKFNPDICARIEDGTFTDDEMTLAVNILRKVSDLTDMPLYSVSTLLNEYETSIGSLGECLTLQTAEGSELFMLTPEYSTTQSMALSFMYSCTFKGCQPSQPISNELVKHIKQLSSDVESASYAAHLLTLVSGELLVSDADPEHSEFNFKPENMGFDLDEKTVRSFAFVQNGYDPYLLQMECITHFFGIEITHPVVPVGFDGTPGFGNGVPIESPKGGDPTGKGPIPQPVSDYIAKLVDSGVAGDVAREVAGAILRDAIPFVGTFKTGINVGKKIANLVSKSKNIPAGRQIRMLANGIAEISASTSG